MLRSTFSQTLSVVWEVSRKSCNAYSQQKNTAVEAKKVANLDASMFLKKAYKSKPGDFVWSPCLLHPNQKCPVYGSKDKLRFPVVSKNDELWIESDSESEDELFLTAVIGGVPCVDSTFMNNHCAGDGGSTYLTAQTFLQGRGVSREKLMWVECTRRWNSKLLADVIDDTHKLWEVELDCSETSDNYARTRLGLLALQFGWHPVVDLDKFLCYAGASPNFPFNKFFQSIADEHLQEMSECAAIRVTPVQENTDMAWEDVLNVSQLEYLYAYTQKFELMKEKGCVHDDCSEFVCDLDQKPHRRPKIMFDHPNKKAMLSTLVTHQTLFHSGKRIIMTALDHARAHCWPVTHDERMAYGGMCCNIPMALETRLFSHKELVRMVGDGWSLRSQGQWLMFLLASVEYVWQTPRQIQNPVDSDSEDMPICHKAKRCCLDSPRSEMTYSISDEEL